MTATIPQNTPQSWVDLMTRCWAEDETVRPDFKDIIPELLAMNLPTDAVIA